MESDALRHKSKRQRELLPTLADIMVVTRRLWEREIRAEFTTTTTTTTTTIGNNNSTDSGNDDDHDSISWI
jgi:hypothetical protein